MVLRGTLRAFHPESPGCGATLDASVFGVVRGGGHYGEPVVCLTNVANAPVTVDAGMAADEIGPTPIDLLSGDVLPSDVLADDRTISLAAYQSVWLSSSTAL